MTIFGSLQIFPRRRLVAVLDRSQERPLASPLRGRRMPGLPTGKVTFLLTDVEGSTRLWGEHPELAGRALARHDEIVGAVVTEHRGVIPHRGEGDSVLAAFSWPEDAVAAALALQLAIGAEQWPGGIPF